jgi:hypothetical protein
LKQPVAFGAWWRAFGRFAQQTGFFRQPAFAQYYLIE